MITGREARISLAMLALLIGLCVPGFLLGPYLFTHIPLVHAPAFAVGGSIVVAALCVWVLLIVAFAEESFLVKTNGWAWLGELAILLLPFFLIAGIFSIARNQTDDQKEEHAP